MFGCVVPQLTGLLLGFVQIDATHWLVHVPVSTTSDVNELVLFLTGQALFPEDLGASVYCGRLTASGEVGWHYLGHLSSTKPSDIFRLPSADVAPASAAAAPGFASRAFGASSVPTVADLQIGIEIEPLSGIQNRETGTTSYKEALHMEVRMAEVIAHDLFHFLASYAKPIAASSADGIQEYIVAPQNCLDLWMGRFRAKVLRDRHFWKK